MVETKNPKFETLNPKLVIQDLSIWYDCVEAVRNISFDVEKNEILGIIGPSNSGKTSFLRTINRLNELYLGSRHEGKILLDDENVFDLNVFNLRKRVGIVFALPLPLPMSIFDNIAYGPKLHGTKDK